MRTEIDLYRHPGESVRRDGEWLTWPADDYGDLADVDDSTTLLDAFCRLARPVAESRRERLLLGFVEEWGPWAACDLGYLHADFDAPGLGPLPVPLSQLRAETDARRRRRPAPVPQPLPSISPRQWIPDLLLSAERVNALRAIVASVLQGSRADPLLWAIVWPTTHRRPFTLDSPEEEGGAAAFIVKSWIDTVHVEFSPGLGAQPGVRVCGVAGALAVAMANEFEPPHRVARCQHMLRAGHCGDLPIGDESVEAERCGLTWRPGRRTKGGGLPPRCPPCDHLHRVAEGRIDPATRADARASNT
jgi:hypothetical protein